MSEAVWNDIDDWFVTTFTASMGQVSSYATLKCQTVEATILRDLQDIARWTLPAIIADGEVVNRESITNVVCNNRYRKTMPYIIMGIVEGTREQVTVDAKILEKRIERTLRPLEISIAGANEGDNVTEKAYKLILGNSQISISPKPLSQNGSWYGIASFELIVYSETRTM